MQRYRMPAARNAINPAYVPFSAMVDEEDIYVYGLLSGS